MHFYIVRFYRCAPNANDAAEYAAGLVEKVGEDMKIQSFASYPELMEIFRRDHNEDDDSHDVQRPDAVMLDGILKADG